MKKGLLLLLAGFMAFGVAVQSVASTRINSMSADVRQIEDYDLIWLYANKVLEYKGTVDFRLNDSFNNLAGTLSDNWGGVLIAEEGLGVIGAYINRPSRMYNANHNLEGGNGAGSPIYRRLWNRVGNAPWFLDIHTNNNKNLDIFWADSLGDADLGLQLAFSDADSSSGDSLEYGLSAGLGFKDAGPFTELNIHAGYTIHSFDFGNDADNGISTIKIGGLGQADLGTDNTLRLFADAEVNNYDLTDHAGYKYSDWGVLLGLACNHKVNGGKGLVSTGLFIDYLSANMYDYYGGPDDYLTNSWNLIWNASLEAQATNWLTLRAGISATLLNRVYDNNSGNGGDWYNNSNGGILPNTGFAITWQNFVLNAQVSFQSLENLLSSPNAGAGIFYPGTAGSTGQGIVAVTGADFKYKF